MLSAVIFDCDGVLFDSGSANVAYYNAVLHQLGQPPLDLAWEQQVHFLASSQVFERMFGSDAATLAEARRIARDLDYGPFYEFMRPVPGLDALLDRLKRSYRLAMASNRGKTITEIMRRFGLDRYLELAVGVLDVAHPKPSPDMIEKCLDHFGLAPQAAVYVGDAETDLAAATAAGVHFVAVGDHDWTPYRIRHLHELPERLTELARA